MIKRLFSLGLALMLVMSTVYCFADTPSPYADTEFVLTTASLATNKHVSFLLTTYEQKSSIYISSVKLQKQNASGTWSTISSLPTCEW